MQQKDQAVGSMWNPNSWHWEQKNYTENVSKLIENKIKEIVLECSTAKVSHTKVVAKGEAEVLIRKGKQMTIFDFEVECEFRGENSLNEIEGSYKIIDINQSDMDFEILEIKVNKTDFNILAHDSKELIRKTLKKLLEATLSTLVKEIQFYELQKVEELSKQRQEQNQQIQKLQMQNSQVQQQMLQEQKEKEYQQKIKNNMPQENQL